MPLLFHKNIQPEGEIGIWQIEESESFFLDQMNLWPAEVPFLDTLKGHRKLEWLAGRWLLHLMSGRTLRGACLKDEFGKPYLEGSLYDISISHSREMVAVMAAPRKVGIDIQVLVGKIERLANKYMNEAEIQSLQDASRLEHLHVYWGAKECLYKAYGRRQLDFRQHILIHPFSYDLEKATCSGEIIKEDHHSYYLLNYEKIDNFILVYALEDIGDQRWV